MSKLSALQARTVELIKARFPRLKTCKPHPGAFTVEQLKEFRTHAPAVHVALPTIREVETAGSGKVKITVKTVIAIITKDGVVDGKKLPKDKAALAIVESLLIHLPNAEFGLGVEPVELMAADNLFSGKTTGGGVAMWAMHWNNTLLIEDTAEDGVELSELYFSFAPEIGVEHIDAYEAASEVGA